MMIQVEFDNAVLELRRSPCFEQDDLSSDQVAKLMSNLLSDLPSDSPVLDTTQQRVLIIAAQSKHGKETIAPVLHRIFICLSLSPGQSLVRLLLQLGPEIIDDPEIVRALLERFNISVVNPPRENLIAQIISTLACLAAAGKTKFDADVDLERWLSDNERWLSDNDAVGQPVWPVVLWVALQVKARYSSPRMVSPDINSLLAIIGSKADEPVDWWHWDDADEQLLRQKFISQDAHSSRGLIALTHQTSRPRINPTEYDASIRVSALVLWTSSTSISASQESNAILTLDRFVADMVENVYMVDDVHMVGHVYRPLPQRFISCVFAGLLRNFGGDKRLDDFRARVDEWKTWDAVTCLINFRFVLRRTLMELSKLIEASAAFSTMLAKYKVHMPAPGAPYVSG
ncbi:hypothetical protein B0H14DRAFT_2733847 [Mycena olivaceomarginata]|nr:hypothetical protein B0H14DRAFT_2733847 [Mycena olivaceomarginata]